MFPCSTYVLFHTEINHCIVWSDCLYDSVSLVPRPSRMKKGLVIIIIREFLVVFSQLVNPRRACAGVTVVVSCVCLSVCYRSSCFSVSLVPRPRPPGEGKGLVTIARFLVCAESAVLFSRQPIRLLGLKISCDIKRPRTADWFRNLNGRGAHHMIVRFCYAVYLQLLNQHNQEFRR